MKSKLAVVILILTACAVAQNGSVKLSDSYAKTALLALKAARAEQGDGTGEASHLTQDKVDAADVEATSEEKASLDEIKHFYVRHIIDNLNAQTIMIKYEMRADRGASTAATYRDDPTLKVIQKNETACADAIEKKLRAREWKASQECIAPFDK